jgi:hypothetical protein
MHLGLGDYGMTFTALDKARLWASCLLSFSVVDLEPPAVITCPASKIVSVGTEFSEPSRWFAYWSRWCDCSCHVHSLFSALCRSHISRSICTFTLYSGSHVHRQCRLVHCTSVHLYTLQLLHSTAAPTYTDNVDSYIVPQFGGVFVEGVNGTMPGPTILEYWPVGDYNVTYIGQVRFLYHACLFYHNLPCLCDHTLTHFCIAISRSWARTRRATSTLTVIYI